jgi:CDP-glucose 4,6-dehydratase
MDYDALDFVANTPGPILITGHSGFKGTWLTLLLESRGLEIHGISLPESKDSLYSLLNRKGKIQEKFLDIRDLANLKKVISEIKPSVIFHLAAQAIVLDSYNEPLGTFETNVIGTANLLEAVSLLSERTIVVAITTDKVYKNMETGKRFSETDELMGKDPYSASKVGTESVITAWGNIWQIEDSHRICAARAGNVIGGGDLAQNRLMSDIVRGYRDHSPVLIRDYSARRPWQHALDPLLGYIKIASALHGGEKIHAMNFGPLEKSLSVRDVVDIVQTELPGEIIFLNEESKPNVRPEANILELDSSLAMEILNWSPRWKQEEAVRRTLSWWKNVISGQYSPEEASEEDIQKFLN